MQFDTKRATSVKFNPQLLTALGNTHLDVMKAARSLAQNIVAHAPMHPCTMEIEIGFQNLLPSSAQFILTALDRGKTKWKNKDSEWKDVSDSFIRLGQQLVRVRSVDGGIREQQIKSLLCRVDCEGINNLRARVNVKTEHDPEMKDLSVLALALPESVRRQTRRSFVSSDSNGTRWNYDIGQAWVGVSGKDAESLMCADTDNSRGRTMVMEIESTLEWKRKGKLNPTADQVLMLCVSLLLKAQDIAMLITRSRELRFSDIKRTRADEGRRPSVPKPIGTVAQENSRIKKRLKRKRTQEKKSE
jgi:hypothetical protein